MSLSFSDAGLRNVQNSEMLVQRLLFCQNKPIAFFAVLVAVVVVVALAPSCCDPRILLPW